MTRALLLLCALMPSIASAMAPSRRTVVVAVGERVVYEASAPIAIVSLAVPVHLGTKPILRYEPEQYGRSIAITGLAAGEATLLVQDTSEKLADIVRVVVASSSYRDAYRQAVAGWGASSLDELDVYPAPPLLVLAGTVYSARALERCARAEDRKSSVICAARLAPVASVVGGDCTEPRASLELISPAGTDADWTGTLRIGEIPVLAIATDDVFRLLTIGGEAARTLNHALIKWRKTAQQGWSFPVTFRSTMSGEGYELFVQWSSEQGSRGERLAQLRAGEFTLGRMSGDPARALAWEVALLTDAMRLYTLGRAPTQTISRADTGLGRFYRNALHLAGGSFNDWSCAAPLARSFVSLRWSTGMDPLHDLATRVPDDFRR